MENRVRYSGIDVCKFIMALLVVWAHTSPLYGINNTLNEMWVHSPPLGAQANFNRTEKHDTM